MITGQTAGTELDADIFYLFSTLALLEEIVAAHKGWGKRRTGIGLALMLMLPGTTTILTL
jgi:hypothetical protein